MQSSRGIAKIVIALIALGAAGAMTYRFITNESKDVYPADAQPPRWTCMECGHQFQLPFAELDRIQAEANAAPTETPPPPEGDAPGTLRAHRTQKTVSAVSCPKCNKKSAVLSTNRCEAHDLYYPNQDLKGMPGVCPKCKASESDE